ncbi:patatin-like phospholipase family protein, partial [Bacteroidales bacterium OttesenSCG-928-L14]|nr:patatin-like phospholipase family protein [Bacteroidales bacterium OttesenSCG-928-L14]
LGVYEAFLEYGIKPEIISGVSAGSLVGAFIADGCQTTDILDKFKDMSFREFTDIRLHNNRQGISKTTKLRAFLKEHIKARTFEDLSIPLHVLATNFEEGKTVEFSQGLLIAAVAASCSFPVVFSPTVINKVKYVDGGLFKNFPVSTIRDKCEFLVGININPKSLQKTSETIMGTVERCIHFVLDANTENDEPLCDILIKPEALGDYSLFDVKYQQEIFEIGYVEAIKIIKENESVLRNYKNIGIKKTSR